MKTLILTLVLLATISSLSYGKEILIAEKPDNEWHTVQVGEKVTIKHNDWTGIFSYEIKKGQEYFEIDGKAVRITIPTVCLNGKMLFMQSKFHKEEGNMQFRIKSIHDKKCNYMYLNFQ